MESKDRIKELERLIVRYQKSYYNGEGEISDSEFDALWEELKGLDPNNPILGKVGTDSGPFRKTRHVMPMGSQEKASSEEEFLAWVARHKYDEYIVEYKLDGASLELQYEEGNLVRAVTRGDGTIGDDITSNARKFHGVASEVRGGFTGAVRGEVIMTHETHQKYYSNKANCRNAANGLMKRKDGTGSEHLMLITYDAWTAEEVSAPFVDEEDKVKWLVSQGFNTVPIKVCHSAQEVIEYRKEVAALRPSLEYDIDGLVIKERRIDRVDAMRSRPDRQIAFKFELDEAITTLRQVEWSQNGGTYTPVAVFDEVQLAGTTVRRASLSNPDTMRALGVAIGCSVLVVKRGEIIPKVMKVIPPQQLEATARDAIEPTGCNGSMVSIRPTAYGATNGQRPTQPPTPSATQQPSPTRGPLANHPVSSAGNFAPVRNLAPSSSLAPIHNPVSSSSNLAPIPYPAVCETCGTALVDEGSRLFCPNKGCPKRVLHQLLKWVSVVDIRDMGETLVTSMFKAGVLTCISDIYNLTEEVLSPFFLNEESLASDKKSLGAAKVLASINGHRRMTLASFVGGFDIEGIGETMAQKLVEAGYNTLEKLLDATPDQFAAVYGFAATMAKIAVEGLAENASEMRSLVHSGAIIIEETSAGSLAGKSFCFTGELRTMKRADAQSLVKQNGGAVKSSVTKDLSYLVTNDKTSGSQKNAKAMKAGVAVIDEEEFLAMVRK